MSGLLLGGAAALWLGVLTSMSPCPMATNIAAVSFIGRKVERPGYVLATGLLYALGRALAYVALAAILLYGLAGAPGLSSWLQSRMNRYLGPVLIVVGMFLLEMIPFPAGRGIDTSRMQARIARMGLWGALLLGALFALAFCPVSAALFFGSLLPLAFAGRSPFLLPAIYGLGTALPVVAFAVVIAVGARHLARAYDRVQAVELWARRATGTLFILVGIYFSLVYSF